MMFVYTLSDIVTVCGLALLTALFCGVKVFEWAERRGRAKRRQAGAMATKDR